MMTRERADPSEYHYAFTRGSFESRFRKKEMDMRRSTTPRLLLLLPLVALAGAPRGADAVTITPTPTPKPAAGAYTCTVMVRSVWFNDTVVNVSPSTITFGSTSSTCLPSGALVYADLKIVKWVNANGTTSKCIPATQGAMDSYLKTLSHASNTAFNTKLYTSAGIDNKYIDASINCTGPNGLDTVTGETIYGGCTIVFN
jgi:hypothetical protein